MKTYPSAPIPVDQVNYEVGRDMIRTGDIISFFESHEESWFHRISTKSVLFFTGSPIYHTGVAVWMDPDGDSPRRLMLVESVAVGRRLVNLSHFKDRKMEVHHLPDYLNSGKVVDYLLDDLGQRYGFWNLIAISIKEFFGFTPRSTKSLVCSESAAAAWKEAGFPMATINISPGRLRNYLGDNGAPPAILINPDMGD